MKPVRIFASMLLCAALAACAGKGPSETPPPFVKVGKPYTVDGKTYVPEPNTEYDEVGLASWYGPGFHGKATATGERFNKHDLTAAHPTLPMPSIVRVTNLVNGKSVVVRINDRGPFKEGRIIDLSKSAAEEIGLKQMGVAQVRVQFLSKETEEYIAKLSPENREKNLAAIRGNQATDRDKPTYDAAPIASVGIVSEANAAERQPVNAYAQSGNSSANASNNAFPTNTLRVQDRYVPSASAQATQQETEQEVADDADSANNEGNRGNAEGASAVAEKPSRKARGERWGDASLHNTQDQEQSNGSRQGAASGKAYVQVGAYSSRANAEKVQRQVAGLAAPKISAVDVQGKTLYRLRLGPVKDVAAGERILEKLESMGVQDAKLVHE